MAERVTVEIVYDDHGESWEGMADRLGTAVVHEERGASIHEQLRGVPVAVRVDVVLRSYVDRYWRPAVLYVTPERMRAEYGADNAETRATALRVLTAEAREYRAWADGYVFAVLTRREHTCPDCSEWHVTERDAIGGFVTDNPEHDLPAWAGQYLESAEARAALSLAVNDGWTGGYPVAARGTVEIEIG